MCALDQVMTKLNAFLIKIKKKRHIGITVMELMCVRDKKMGAHHKKEREGEQQKLCAQCICSMKTGYFIILKFFKLKQSGVSCLTSSH